MMWVKIRSVVYNKIEYYNITLKPGMVLKESICDILNLNPQSVIFYSESGMIRYDTMVNKSHNNINIKIIDGMDKVGIDKYLKSIRSVKRVNSLGYKYSPPHVS
jgi:hypothetical protein